MTNVSRTKFSKISAILLLAAALVQLAPATAAAQSWSWWNLGWTSRTTYRPLLGGYRTAYYPTFAPQYVAPAPVAYDGCSTCQPECSTCYRPSYVMAPQTVYRPVTYYRPLSTPVVSYYQPSCGGCGSISNCGSCGSCGSCSTGCNSCSSSSYPSGGSSCHGCEGQTSYPAGQPYQSGGQLAPVPSNGSQTPQPSLAPGAVPNNAPRSIYTPQGSDSRTFQENLRPQSAPDANSSVNINTPPPALAPVKIGPSENGSPSYDPNVTDPNNGVPPSIPGAATPNTAPSLRPLPTRSTTRGLFGTPRPAPVQDKTAAVEHSVSRVTPASHTIAEPRRLSQEEIDAAGWRSAR